MYVDVEIVETSDVWCAIGEHEVDGVGGVLGFRGWVVRGVEGAEEEGHCCGVGYVGAEGGDALEGGHGLEVDCDDLHILSRL